MALEAAILPQVKCQRRSEDQNHWATEVPLETNILRMQCLENRFDTADNRTWCVMVKVIAESYAGRTFTTLRDVLWLLSAGSIHVWKGPTGDYCISLNVEWWQVRCGTAPPAINNSLLVKVVEAYSWGLSCWQAHFKMRGIASEIFLSVFLVLDVQQLLAASSYCCGPNGWVLRTTAVACVLVERIVSLWSCI